MAASYPSMVPFTADDERYRPDDVYHNPHSYDYERNPERKDSAMQRTAQYVSGLHADADSFLTDDHTQHNHRHQHSPHYHHHHHHHHPLPPPHTSDALPALTIRRHTPGSTDPSLQKLPTNLQPTSENISPSSKVHVTIKRNEIPPDQTVIQPLLYPVAVYVNTPVQQIFDDRPIQPMKALPKPPSPKTPSYFPVPPKPDETLFQPIKPLHKPPSPKKPSPPPPASSDRYETESFHLPPSRKRNNNVTPRRPIRVDVVPKTPFELQPERVRSPRVVLEEYDDYDEYYQAPSVYTVPQKVISYRTAAGMTTRERQNDEMENPQYMDDVESPPTQTITYRT